MIQIVPQVATLEASGRKRGGRAVRLGGIIERFERHEALVLGIRFLLVVVLFAFSIFGLIEMDKAEGQRFVVGLTLLFIVGFVQVAMGMLGMRDMDRATRYGFPFDVVALALISSAMVPFDNALYPIFIVVAVGESFGSSRRMALGFGLFAAFGYIAGHVAGHTGSGVAVTVIHAFNAASIVILPVGVATVFDAYRAHAAEIEQSDGMRAELAERLQSRLAELQAVSSISEVIHSDLDFERVGPMMLDILQKVLSIPSVCVMVIDKSKSETLFTSSKGLRARGNAAAGLIPGFLGGDSNAISDDHLACFTVIEHHNLQVVFCSEPSSIEALTPEDQLVLQAVASELVVAVENSQLYKLTKRLAITDELTGLHNYRHLQNRLEEEFERARRYRKDLSLLMIDADDFKGYNDTYGHVAGDTALAELGAVLRRSVREVDLVARYGGEEFSIILPETDSAGAFVVAEKIREAVANHLFLDADEERMVRVTVSVGIASYPSHASDRESLLREADGALYKAKNSGKNRVRAPERPHPVFEIEDIAKEN